MVDGFVQVNESYHTSEQTCYIQIDNLGSFGIPSDLNSFVNATTIITVKNEYYSY